MINSKEPSPYFSSIDPEKLFEFLKHRQWDFKNNVKDKFSIWVKGDKKLYIPLDKNAFDYKLRINEVFQDLSNIEKLALEEISNNTSIKTYDTIRIQVDAPGFIEGSISLKKAANLYSGGKALLIASANAAHSKKPSYSGKSISEVEDYINTVRVGQSEIGSYVAKFLSPLPPDVEQLPGIAQREVFERSVTETLVKSIKAMNECVARFENTDNKKVFNEFVEQGLSSNLCEAAILLCESSSRENVNIDITWSPIVEPKTICSVSLEKSSITTLITAANYLRNLEEPDEYNFEGYVSELMKDEVKTFDKGLMKFWAKYKGSYRIILIALTKNMHELATIAYKDSLKIKITGKVTRRGRRLYIPSPESFTIIPN